MTQSAPDWPHRKFHIAFTDGVGIDISSIFDKEFKLSGPRRKEIFDAQARLLWAWIICSHSLRYSSVLASFEKNVKEKSTHASKVQS